MELSVIFLFLLPCLSTVTSYPKKTELIPKDSYKRQILQPIPGYIPVYIKADGEPLVRTKMNPTSHVLTKTADQSIEKTGEADIKPRVDDGASVEGKENVEKEIKLLKTKEKFEKTKSSQTPKS